MLTAFYCPECKIRLDSRHGFLLCSKCQQKFFRKNGIFVLLPKDLAENKIKEDLVYTLNDQDNSWYNRRVWYYFIHLSSHIIRFEREIIGKIRGPRVLEVACGNGWASLLVKRKRPQWKVYATDVSFRSINIQARQMSKIMDASPDYWVVCDAEKLPFKDGSFDTVFIVASLHHFAAIEKALSEFRRVLKPGGIFLAIDGMMPRIAQKVLGDEESDRTKRFGILERKITYDDWLAHLKKAEISETSLRLNYDPSYLHSYATNPDETRIIKKSWLFNIAKEVVYGAILSKFPWYLIKKLKLTSIFPAGVVIEYKKPKTKT